MLFRSEHYALMSNRVVNGVSIAWRWCDQPNQVQNHQPGFVCEWEPKTETSTSVAGAMPEAALDQASNAGQRPKSTQPWRARGKRAAGGVARSFQPAGMGLIRSLPSTLLPLRATYSSISTVSLGSLSKKR